MPWHSNSLAHNPAPPPFAKIGSGTIKSIAAALAWAMFVGGPACLVVLEFPALQDDGPVGWINFMVVATIASSSALPFLFTPALLYTLALAVPLYMFLTPRLALTLGASCLAGGGVALPLPHFIGAHAPLWSGLFFMLGAVGGAFFFRFESKRLASSA